MINLKIVFIYNDLHTQLNLFHILSDIYKWSISRYCPSIVQVFKKISRHDLDKFKKLIFRYISQQNLLQ